jgi:hypothetical protein
MGTDVQAAEKSANNLAVWIVAGLTAAVHLAVAGRYDIFRNELYFIVCGWRPAFGYADQPPLVPLIAAATQLFGENVWLLRLPAVIAAVTLVPVTAALARLFGGGNKAALLAAVAAAIAPALMALTGIVTTETFEPIAWTACAYFVARAVVRDDRSALIWAGIAAGLGMEAKYGMAIWLIGLAAGVVLTSARRILAWRECWYGIALAVLISAPSLIWQTLNGWPFFAVILHHSTAHSNFTGTPLRFEIIQALAMNVVLAPLWLVGVIAPFTVSRLAPARFLAIAFVLSTIIVIATGGKDYYLFAAYPVMFAVGAAAFGDLRGWLAGLWTALAILQSLILTPIMLPVFTPEHLARYLDRTHLRPPPNEAAAIGAPLTQVYSDELGWRALEKQVADIYRALPPSDRAHAAILASNYGEAAAIDVYGRKDGLPPALSGQNQYFLWGPRGADGQVIIHINGNPNAWRRLCGSVTVLGQFGVPYAMPYENNRPIFICRGLHMPLVTLWPHLKRYQ